METNTAMFDGPITLINSAWSVLRSNWKILLPISITPSIIGAIAQIIGVAGAAFVFVSLLVSIVGIVFSISMAPALLDAVSKIDKGASSSIKYWPQYKIGFSYFFVVLGLGILEGLMIIGSGMLLVIPAIIVGVFIGMNVYARILDGHKGLSAFTESFSLVKGRWWRVFGRVIVLSLVYIAISIVMGVVVMLIAIIFGSTSPVTAVLASIIQILFVAIISPFAMIYMYKLYNSLKVTRMNAVATGSFKKWLIAFLVIGVIALVLIPLSGMFLVKNYTNRAGYSGSLNSLNR